MEYIEIREGDRLVFHEMASAYYREGEDADTAQEVIDSFIHLLFDKVIHKEISGCFVKDGHQYVGFALWAVDSETFAFCEMPGLGTILEIGLTAAYRSSGLGTQLVAYVESNLRKSNITECYVSAYGPALAFWANCGYSKNGRIASNGLPIMVKTIL